MSFQAYDSRGFISDIATNKGWEDFCVWASGQTDRAVRALAEYGYATELNYLVDALQRSTILDEATDEVRQAVIAAATQADGVLIVNDGAPEGE